MTDINDVGLTVPEIASAFPVPEPTMAQRATRAKQKIKSAGAPYLPLSAYHAQQATLAEPSLLTRRRDHLPVVS